MPSLPDTLFLAQIVSTLFMTGLIWFVQIVHYPLFATVHTHTAKTAFVHFEAQHANRTGWVVFPPMLIELLTALAALLPRLRPHFLSSRFCFYSASLVVLLWISTGIVQIPLHNRLSAEPDQATIRRLVRSNWLRTILWTARALLLTGALLKSLESGILHPTGVFLILIY